jgi:hypothetical protein
MTKQITSQQILSILIKECSVDFRSPVKNLILDYDFLLLPDRVAAQIIERDTTNKLTYKPQTGDCDNYAFELRNAFGRYGYACGVLIVHPDKWETAHAVFFYINQARQVRIVEPQNDKPFTTHCTLIAVIMY